MKSWICTACAKRGRIKWLEHGEESGLCPECKSLAEKQREVADLLNRTNPYCRLPSGKAFTPAECSEAIRIIRAFVIPEFNVHRNKTEFDAERFLQRLHAMDHPVSFSRYKRTDVYSGSTIKPFGDQLKDSDA